MALAFGRRGGLAAFRAMCHAEAAMLRRTMGRWSSGCWVGGRCVKNIYLGPLRLTPQPDPPGAAALR